jgi:hypothetical protein
MDIVRRPKKSETPTCELFQILESPMIPPFSVRNWQRLLSKKINKKEKNSGDYPLEPS